MTAANISGLVDASTSGELRTHLDALESLVLSDLDEANTVDLAAANTRAVRLLSAVDLQISAHLSTLGGLGTEAVYGTVGKLSTGAARSIERRAALADAMPAIATAFTAGRVGVENIDRVAIARHSLRHNAEWVAEFDRGEAGIVRKASRMAPKEFTGWMNRTLARISDTGATDHDTERARNTVRFGKDSSTGRWRGSLDFDALTGEKLAAAIAAQAKSIATRAKNAGDDGHHGPERNAQALEALIDSGNGAKGRASVNVIVDAETLVNGWWEHSIGRTSNGTWIPLPLIRRLMCDSDVVTTIMNTDGRALDVGRAQRTVTPAQRHALAAMYETCAMCDTPFEHTEIHHIQYWRNNGRTDLSNLLPLCSVHHHKVHDEGWMLAMGRDRQLSVTTPNGGTVRTVPLPSAHFARRRHSHRHRQRPPITTE